MKYAGIGSRETPENVLHAMETFASYMGSTGHLLRSGAANGADSAFEYGCKGKKEIYLPWLKYNDHESNNYIPSKKAYEISSKCHPAWERLNQAVQKLHASNAHIVLGKNCDDPVDLVVCYTKEGKGAGGTGQALRIAKDYDIEVFDFGNYEQGFYIDMTSVKAALWKRIRELLS